VLAFENGPVDLADPADLVDLVDPVNPVDPPDPVDPVGPVGPVDPPDPVGPVGPVGPERPQIEDAVLMSRIQNGDTGAYTAFYERYTAVARAVAMRTLHDPLLAHEVAQDGFLAIWNQREQFVSERGTPRGWLLAMVQHRAIDVVRRESKRRRNETAGDEALGPRAGDTVEEQVIGRDEARAVHQLLAGIPDKQRRVIELAYVDGLSQSEIALELQLPLGTVKGQTRLGLEKLRQAYAD
jgi:RNA polymerase sigma-70 factor (ECF subfamily)